MLTALFFIGLFVIGYFGMKVLDAMRPKNKSKFSQWLDGERDSF